MSKYHTHTKAHVWQQANGMRKGDFFLHVQATAPEVNFRGYMTTEALLELRETIDRCLEKVEPSVTQ